MKENKSIDNLKELIEDELIWLEDEIDQFVETNMEANTHEFPDELDQIIMGRIRQEEEKMKAYELLSEEDKEALRIGREALLMRDLDEEDEECDRTETPEEKTVAFKKRSKKVIAMVALVAILTFAFCMVGIGENPLIQKMRGVDLGEKEITRVESENDEENINQSGDEELLEQQIKETFDTNFVRMEYLPEGTTLAEGIIRRDNKEACFLYKCNDIVIEYKMIFNYRKQSYGYDVEDELLEENTKTISGVPVVIKVYQLPNGIKQRVALFKYKKTFYILNGAVSEQEFEKILINLNFF